MEDKKYEIKYNDYKQHFSIRLGVVWLFSLSYKNYAWIYMLYPTHARILCAYSYKTRTNI